MERLIIQLSVIVKKKEKKKGPLMTGFEVHGQMYTFICM